MLIAPTDILLIESNPADAQLIKDALRNEEALFCVVWVRSLAEALVYLSKKSTEIILLDLALPDGKGLGAFDQVTAAAPDALILVLSAASDETLRRAGFRRRERKLRPAAGALRAPRIAPRRRAGAGREAGLH